MGCVYVRVWMHESVCERCVGRARVCMCVVNVRKKN